MDSGDPSAVLLGGGGGWCSGTLIAPKVVLTAGHCISPNNNFVYFGPQYLGDAGGAVITVARSYPNPAYVASNFRNADIGIVILSTPSNVPPRAINAMPLDASAVGQSLQIIGFGATSSPTEPEFTKMEVTVPIATVTAKEIEAGPSICEGDSGGPALLTVNGTQVVAGVTSWHSTASCGGQAGFARVDLYAQWIQQQIDMAEADDGGTEGGTGGGADAGAGADASGDAHGSIDGDTSDAATAGGDDGATPTGPSGEMDGGADGATTAASSEDGGCAFAAGQPKLGQTGMAAALLAIACGLRRRKRTRRR